MYENVGERSLGNNTKFINRKIKRQKGQKRKCLGDFLSENHIQCHQRTETEKKLK